MEYVFLYSICFIFVIILMILVRIWIVFSGIRIDLFWLIKSLVILEKGLGRFFNFIIFSRYISICILKINLYYINCIY